jgi:hypothetical protein
VKVTIFDFSIKVKPFIISINLSISVISSNYLWLCVNRQKMFSVEEDKSEVTLKMANSLVRKRDWSYDRRPLRLALVNKGLTKWQVDETKD